MSNDTRITVLETVIVNINSTLLDIRQDVKELSNKIDNVHNRLWSNFLWLMSMIIGLAGLIAHTQHWI